MLSANILSRSVASDSLCSFDCSPPESSVYGILQARILEWVATSSSGDLPDSRIEPVSPALHVDYALSNQGSPKGLSGGTLILPEALVEDFMGEVAFHQALEGERIIFRPQMWAMLALG